MRNIRSKYTTGIAIFLIWPFLGFLYSIKNFDNINARRLIIGFFALYGFTIINDQYTSDLHSNFRLLQEYALYSGSYWSLIFGNLFKDQASLDFIQKSIVYAISRFTSKEGYLFATYSIIFGIFYIKASVILYDFYLNNKNLNAWIILLLFLLIIPITTIGNFRFFSAVWIFFVGAFHVLYKNEKKYLWIAFSAVAMHFSLIGANLLLLCYLWLGNRKKLYLTIALISFFLPNILGSFIQQNIGFLGFAFEDKANIYLNEDYVSYLSSTQASWFIILRGLLVKYFIIFMLVKFYFFTKNKLPNQGMQNLFSFTLILLSFTNLATNVPSLGGRYSGIFQLFALTYIFLFITINYRQTRVLSNYTYIALIPLLLHFIVTLRQASETINFWLLLPSPLPFIGDPISLFKFLTS
jgi:hypothetical protein